MFLVKELPIKSHSTSTFLSQHLHSLSVLAGNLLDVCGESGRKSKGGLYLGWRKGGEAVPDLPVWWLFVCLLFVLGLWPPNAIPTTPEVGEKTENGEHCQLPLSPASAGRRLLFSRGSHSRLSLRGVAHSAPVTMEERFSPVRAEEVWLTHFVNCAVLSWMWCCCGE